MINKKTQLIQQKKTKTLPKKIIPKDKNLLHNKFLIIIRKILNICGNKKRKKNIIKGGVFENLKSQINNFINNEMKKSMKYFIGLGNMKMKSINYNDPNVINNLETTRTNLLNIMTKDNPNIILNPQDYSSFRIKNKIYSGSNDYQFNICNIKDSATNIEYLFFTNKPTFDSTNSDFIINDKSVDADFKGKFYDYYIFIDYLLFNIKRIPKLDLNEQSYNFDYLPKPAPPETNPKDLKLEHYMYNGMIFYNNVYNNGNNKNDYLYNMYKYEDQIYKQKIIINKIKLDEDELELSNLFYFDIDLLKVYGKNMNGIDFEKKNKILKHAAIINIGITLNDINDIV